MIVEELDVPTATKRPDPIVTPCTSVTTRSTTEQSPGSLSMRRNERVAFSRRDLAGYEEAFPLWLGFVPIVIVTAFALSLHYGIHLLGPVASAPTYVDGPSATWNSGGSIR